MIRPYQAADENVVLQIWRDASAVAHPFLEPAFLNMAEQMIRKDFLPIAETWIAEQNQTPVGFIAALGDEIGGLFVCPNHHGLGLGRALMDHALRTRDAVALDVFRDNAIGRRFYASYGFVEGAHSIGAMSGLPEIRLHYTKV